MLATKIELTHRKAAKWEIGFLATMLNCRNRNHCSNDKFCDLLKLSFKQDKKECYLAIVIRLSPEVRSVDRKGAGLM